MPKLLPSVDTCSNSQKNGVAATAPCDRYLPPSYTFFCLTERSNATPATTKNYQPWKCFHTCPKHSPVPASPHALGWWLIRHLWFCDCPNAWMLVNHQTTYSRFPKPSRLFPPPSFSTPPLRYRIGTGRQCYPPHRPRQTVLPTAPPPPSHP